MSTYRKPTEKELKRIYLFLKGQYETEASEDQAAYKEYAKEFYPKTASSMLISLSSEYNDETYDYRIGFVVVYDKDGEELLPLKGKSVEAREQAFDLPNPYEGNECWEEQETEIVVSLSNEADFDLYVKE